MDLLFREGVLQHLENPPGYRPDRHNVNDECGLTGELASIVGHKPHQNFAWNCERRGERCDNIIHYSDVHLPTNCPCYCPHCDTTADREVIIASLVPRPVKKKIVPPKIFILGQNFSAIMLKIFILP